MKSSKFITLFLGCMAAAVLSSCSSSVEIVKRKHNDGYYVHVNKSVKPTDKQDNHSLSASITDNAEIKNESPSPNVLLISESPVLIENTVSATESKKPAVVTKSQFKNLKDLKSLSYEEKITYTPSSKLEQIKKFKQFSSETNSPKRVEDIVLVILCFLLPPLAVYLKEGIGTPFWIDVILTCIFWVPGIIYAIIVCFA